MPVWIPISCGSIPPIVLALLTLALPGCGGGAGPAGTVQGVVTFGDKPVTEGRVQFHSTETGYSGLGVLGEEGKFTLDGKVPAGSYTVFVMPPEEPAPTSPTPPPKKVYPLIPPKYRTEISSDLKIVVDEGENDFAFDLKS